MRSTLVFLLILVAGPAWGQAANDRYDTEMAGRVFTAALQFIAPRTLEAFSIQQLTMWGLREVTTLDPALTPQLANGVVTLTRGAEMLFQRPAPPEDDPAAWAALAADLIGAAWAASPTLQQQGAQATITGFFDEMFNHLDPYSRYVAPDAADQDRARRSGEAGAGITIARTGAAITVQSVNGDGPAADAGIRPGDQITFVDDQPTQGADLATVQGWIAGAEGSDLTLTVRSRNGRIRTVDLERAVLPPETVFASRSGTAALVRISGFASDTDDRVAHELDLLFAHQPPRGLIIDLRGNRGGLLRQAVSATDLLLDSGVVATAAGRDPQAEHAWRATEGDMIKGRPVVVLVDGRSASAAEIMAGAISDDGRGVVVGSSTLGKGLVQTIQTLPDGGELFVSWSRVLAPSGWPYQALGVLPQVCTSLGGDQLAQEMASLAKGVPPMAAALARHRAARAPLPVAEAVALRSACPAAEGRDADITVAHYLIDHPGAYAAALLPPLHPPTLAAP